MKDNKTLWIKDVALSRNKRWNSVIINTVDTIQKYKVGDIFFIEDVYFEVVERKMISPSLGSVGVTNLYKLKSILPNDVLNEFLNDELFSQELVLIDNEETIRMIRRKMCLC